ncbi:MAG TPA: RNA-binding cell elongation regulator Jag/EloR [Syntrophorhabdales bacterium]|nr:RNA-binding cell elongation regulator Jag/EloR [Syntrophorhabdales bacterium]
MDILEFEGKTYEEAVKKAATELNADIKDLDIEVKEVDTKGILGLLGSKKVRIVARLHSKAEEEKPAEALEQTPEEYGKKFLLDIANFLGVRLEVKVSKSNERILFVLDTDDEETLVGREGEVLEGLQHLVRLAIAKKYKENLKLLLDVNDFREKRKKTIIVMAKKLADKARRSRKPIKTKPLNPYERRIIHTLFKSTRGISTSSEGDGHTKRVIISPSGSGNVRS